MERQWAMPLSLFYSYPTNGMKRKLQYLTIAFIAGLLPIFLLVAWKRAHEAAGYFTRQVNNNYVRAGRAPKDLQTDEWHIGGCSPYNVYLRHNRYANIFIKTDLLNSDTQHFYIKDKVLESLPYKLPVTIIDSPYYYIADGIAPLFVKGDLAHTDKAIVEKTTLPFDIAIPISQHAYALRLIDKKEGFCLALKDGQQVIKKPSLLEKQVDGIFCKDGDLLFDKKTGKVIYVYYYRNQFIVADSNLDLLYKGKTIDTVSIAQIKIGNIDKEGKQALASPPTFINKKSCVFNGRLFIYSTIRAKGQYNKLYDHSSNVDVYELTHGNYLFSFYIPDVQEKKLTEFAVSDSTFIGLYGNFVRVFRLNS